MIEIFMLLGVAIIPPLLLFLLTWILDREDKEPILLLGGLFLAGMVSCFPIGIAELILEFFNFFKEGSYLYTFVDMFLIVAICEEVGKFLIVFLITWWSKNFNYRYDAILYSVSVSLGFATLENVLYVLTTQFEDGSGLSVAILRAFLAVPGHFTWAVIMGFFYGLAKSYMIKKETRKMIGMFALGLILPIFAHGFYDFCLTIENPIFIIILFFFVLFIDIVTFVLLHYASKNDKPIFKISLLNNWMINQNLNRVNIMSNNIQSQNNNMIIQSNNMMMQNNNLQNYNMQNSNFNNYN